MYSRIHTLGSVSTNTIPRDGICCPIPSLGPKNPTRVFIVSALKLRNHRRMLPQRTPLKSAENMLIVCPFTFHSYVQTQTLWVPGLGFWAQSQLVGHKGPYWEKQASLGSVRVLGAVWVIWCHLGSCRAILGYSGPIWRYFRPIRDPCGPPKRPQMGLIWHIIINYAPENCFAAPWVKWMNSI